MNLTGIVLRFAAAAAIAAAASMCVVSAGYALFALLEPYLGPAGAAAVVALAAALLALIGALVIFGKARRHGELKARSTGWAERLVDTAKERPLAVAALAVAAGWILVRNPALVSLAAAAMTERSRDRRR